MTGALNGQTAIVTGATSGIGRATALLFAAEGARVVCTGRNADAGAALAVELTTIGEGGVDHLVELGDITDSGFCDSLVDLAVARTGRLDVLANVAGVITRGDAPDTTDHEWRHNMAANVDAVFFLSRAAVRAMRQHGDGGTIVNLASNVGLVGSAGLAAYCASKGAVVQLTRAMALDHAAEGIRVNALCPGAVDTPMLVSGHEKTGRTADDVLTANRESIPERRIPGPDEIAKSMLYLASDASSHVTGVALAIDGGYTAQ